MARESHVRLPVTDVRSGRACGSRGCTRWSRKPRIKLRSIPVNKVNLPVRRERNKPNYEYEPYYYSFSC